MKDVAIFFTSVVVIPAVLISAMLFVLCNKKSSCAICHEEFNQFHIQKINAEEISINLCDDCLKEMILEKIKK